MKQFGKLYRIEPNECITPEMHYDFFYQIQLSLLLALKEMGSLDMMQYRHAEEKMKQYRQERAKVIRKKEISND